MEGREGKGGGRQAEKKERGRRETGAEKEKNKENKGVVEPFGLG